MMHMLYVPYSCEQIYDFVFRAEPEAVQNIYLARADPAIYNNK